MVNFFKVMATPNIVAAAKGGPVAGQVVAAYKLGGVAGMAVGASGVVAGAAASAGAWWLGKNVILPFFKGLKQGWDEEMQEERERLLKGDE